MRKSWLVALALAGCMPTVSTPASDGPEIAGNLTVQDLPVQMAAPLQGAFTQQIDHPTDPTAPSIGTFSQQYWVSTQFASGPNAPVLFYLCGEAPCSGDYVLTMADAAKTLGASVVALEHRYYGNSAPFPDYTLDHMKYLTIHNALEDAAAFETWAKANLPLAGKWIAVGGSYPGMLAAFFRETHPELVVGAWASSAPVNVQLSFTGYDRVAAKALGTTCAKQFDKVLTAFDKAFQSKDPTVAALFGGAFPDSEADMMNSISGIAESAAQYGQYAQLCAALLQESANPMEAFTEYLSPPLVGDPDMAQPAPVDMGGADGDAPDLGGIDGGAPDLGGPTAAPLITSHPAPPANTPAALGMQPMIAPDDTQQAVDFHGSEWFYQVCTEVGFYQIHNTGSGGTVTSSLIDEQYWADQCAKWVSPTPPATAQTNATYYAPLAAGKVTNVFFVNGADDPWSTLSITSTKPPKGLTTLVVQTGSHCSDLNNLQPTSVLGVFQAHKQFHDLAVQWLAE